MSHITERGRSVTPHVTVKWESNVSFNIRSEERTKARYSTEQHAGSGQRGTESRRCKALHDVEAKFRRLRPEWQISMGCTPKGTL